MWVKLSSELCIVASDVENLGGKTISVTVEDTTRDNMGNPFCLKNDKAVAEGYSTYFYYNIADRTWRGFGDIGEECTVFTGNGENIVYVLADVYQKGSPQTERANAESDIMPNSAYTGYIIFGVKLK
ncbi:MAG: hypothetical protein FWB84_04435 [Candidatus Bathyarchaeota archaeon]|uniref:hypothetical protein n=1 Tax=Candidatus Bathycorpusculum sp. TaxID=2994959 RepID=UPI0028186F04|nr:hypothetical protein [Candidatus Termiticorpusculum sp.]MCL2257824.1 hypothetical protein [Candidatus Termiticorpusculum sp.]MCL2292043.1 hypothetical protein [Candidatus Termiticorpusculum sp.]